MYARARRYDREMSEFTVGSKLLGHLIDFDASTPETQVTLERSDDAILLSLTWTDPNSPYARWFWTDSQSTPEDVGPPSQLLFRHRQGTILLVGCSMSSAQGGIWGPSTGVVRAEYAVLDVLHDADYGRVNGVRSSVHGLRAWLGVTSVQTTLTPASNGSPRTATFVAAEGEPIVIGGSSNLRLLPTWLAVPDSTDDTTTIFDEVLCESTNADLHDWSYFLSDHRAIRDLLLLSSWSVQELTPRAALRLELEPHEDGSISQSGSWRKVEPASTEGARDSRAHPQHLVEFADLGPDGISEWIDIRTKFSRAIDPIVSSKLFRHPTIDVNLFLVAMGLEALGYLLALEAGHDEKVASNMRFSKRLTLVADGLGAALPFDVDDWALGTSEAYNSVKHANRAPVDIGQLVLRWKQSVAVFRAWAALRLGVQADAIAQRLDL
jgi:hypothetical protein